MDHRRRQPPALGIGDDVRDARIHRRDQRIGGAQVDADDFAHLARAQKSEPKAAKRQGTMKLAF
jgi:hypothetical protein